MEYKNILFDVDGAVATITFNRPKVLNAMNTEITQELGLAINECRENDGIRVVILTGAGDRAFVAGADIHVFQNKTPAQIMKFTQIGQRILRSIEILEKPVIAAGNGFALGGGLEISMVCDIRFASENARFGQPEILLGLIPGWGGTQRLARLVGMGRARELIYSGEQVTAQRAYDIGLVNRVFPAEQLMEETRKFAQKLATMSPFALHMAKYAINYGCELPVDSGTALEVQCFSQCWSTEDLTEGVSAFLEKRKATFKGK